MTTNKLWRLDLEESAARNAAIRRSEDNVLQVSGSAALKRDSSDEVLDDLDDVEISRLLQSLEATLR